MNQDKIKLAQSELNKMFNDNIALSGEADAPTEALLLRVIILPNHWPTLRKLVGFIQHVATQHGIEAGPIDGKWGTQTEFAHGQLLHKLAHGTLPEPWRREVLQGSAEGQWPLQNETAMTAFFGKVGTNQGKARSPYPLKLSWDTNTVVNRFTCHEKIVPAVERVLNKVLAHYGLEEIKRLGLDSWGGALNVRNMRGGSSWSTHAWGVGIDWDTTRNELEWGRDRAVFAKPEYDYWWACWEEEGAVSLGREQNRDWMHVQFARLK